MSHEAYSTAITLLAAATAELHPAAVVGIANGGMTPARDLAEHLRVPVHQVNARHNISNETHLQATGHVSYDLAPLETTLSEPLLPSRDERPGTVLVVDDICGTGATFTAVLPALLTRLRPHAGAGLQARTVSLCRNVGATEGPDWWTWLVDDWVLFPWETPPATPSPVPIQDLQQPRELNPQQIARTSTDLTPTTGRRDDSSDEEAP
ncbi:phosphoribosyltransferase domain-containing protein [Kineosporia rhizophila]|uniref:phosphoribosyltransferase n=1 Tax=Kineosporia rhizophila TaxID=84633 RepID=UPI000AF60014|nr:phosphoribosyltransferase family protein [Kineosporia rhizophila]MCE0540744.1 phosphoribosyltransferase domain-containing protein [Kineosporia rhizophila]